MTPFLRKFTLTAHVACSVGWLGAVASFLVLSIAGLTSQNGQIARAACLAMDLTAWFVIVPFAFASLLTGIIQSVGTKWGLFRHYWVQTKLLLTVFATIVLLMKMKVISQVAGMAAATTFSGADFRQARTGLLVHAGGGLLVLLTTTILSVYKPWGLTNYGRRKQKVPLHNDSGTPFGVKVFVSAVGVLALIFVVLHFTGHGFEHHGH